jgi:N-acetylmuramoyl-L-alanine amidase
VLAHSDVAPARKQDPGEKFPWRALWDSGVGHWVAPAPISRGDAMKLGADGDAVLALQRALAEYGYGLTPSGHYNPATAEVVTAFQRHFRPQKVDGVADNSTLATLHALLAGLPARQAMQVAADVLAGRP